MHSRITSGNATVSLHGITKRFSDLVALNSVELDLRAGEVHALLGANGSGKSTLVKIMSGVYQPDAGTIEFAEARLAGMGSPAEALARGVRVVHQESPLLDTFTVTESVAMFRGFGTSGLGRVPWRKLRRQVQELLARMNVDVDPNQLCATLSPADRAGLALAISIGDIFAPDNSTVLPRLLIVDEVTASIHESETALHLERLRLIANEGVAVVMVTHRLAELAIADDVTVLRGGEVVYRQNGGARRTSSELVAEMVGPHEPSSRSGRVGDVADNAPVGRLWKVAPPAKKAGNGAGQLAGTPAVRVKDLWGTHIHGLTFEAQPGEIVGFAGLRESGVDELPDIFAGGKAWRSGTIEVGGHRVPNESRPARFIDQGMVTIPADRLHAGGVPSLSVEENVILPGVRNYWHRKSLKMAVTRGVIAAFDVRPPDSQKLFGSLSGGNQQKVLLGKWLTLRPSVLVLDDPTYGVDPAARETIFAAMRDAADRGVCVLFFSTEPEQLVRVCDRVLVLREGTVTDSLSGPSLSLEALFERSYQ